MWSAIAALVLGLLKWLFERSETDYELIEEKREEGESVDVGSFPDF